MDTCRDFVHNLGHTQLANQLTRLTLTQTLVKSLKCLFGANQITFVVFRSVIALAETTLAFVTLIGAVLVTRTVVETLTTANPQSTRQFMLSPHVRRQRSCSAKQCSWHRKAASESLLIKFDLNFWLEYSRARGWFLSEWKWQQKSK